MRNCVNIVTKHFSWTRFLSKKAFSVYGKSFYLHSTVAGPTFDSENKCKWHASSYNAFGLKSKAGNSNKRVVFELSSLIKDRRDMTGLVK